MKLREATIKDFNYGTSLYDKEGNEFIIKDKYQDGIYNTNKGKVIFVCEARFYRVEAQS